jgi:hypothetical protein
MVSASAEWTGKLPSVFGREMNMVWWKLVDVFRDFLLSRVIAVR